MPWKNVWVWDFYFLGDRGGNAAIPIWFHLSWSLDIWMSKFISRTQRREMSLRVQKLERKRTGKESVNVPHCFPDEKELS